VSTWQEMILKVLCLHEKNDNRDWLNKMTAKSLCSLHIDFSVLIFPSLLEHTYFTILNGTGKIWNADYDPKLIDVSCKHRWLLKSTIKQAETIKNTRLQTCTAAVLATTCPDGLPNLHISICLLFEARIGPVFLIRHSLL